MEAVPQTFARIDGIGAHRDRYDELLQRFHSFPPGGAAQRGIDAIRAEFIDGAPANASPAALAAAGLSGES